jgi:hypothetical protein
VSAQGCELSSAPVTDQGAECDLRIDQLEASPMSLDAVVPIARIREALAKARNLFEGVAKWISGFRLQPRVDSCLRFDREQP